MSPKKKLSPQLERNRKDRRHADEGPPPGWLERRHTVERRLPEVTEGEISLSEWQIYAEAFQASRITPTEPEAAPDDTQDAASDAPDQAKNTQ